MKPRKDLQIGMYSPYLSIFGGGERYFLSIASYLGRKNRVTLFTSDIEKKQIEEKLGINIDRIKLENQNFLSQSVLGKYLFFRQFDIFFHMTDGSVFLSGGRKNFLIIQSPIHIPSNKILNRLKLSRWHLICYSEFMRSIIRRRIGIVSTCLCPGVEVDAFRSNQTKRNIILTVGRFFKGLHDKKQDFLADVFIKNYTRYFQGWEFHIAGGLTEGSGIELVRELKKRIKRYPIFIHTNITFNNLVELYKKSKIYWHAAGFGEDLITYPERTEHFGITTIEAMAAGAVPVVFKGGGQQDIVKDATNGFFWSTEKELLDKTTLCMQEKSLLQHVSRYALKRAYDFSLPTFYEHLEKLIQR